MIPTLPAASSILSQPKFSREDWQPKGNSRARTAAGTATEQQILAWRVCKLCDGVSCDVTLIENEYYWTECQELQIKKRYSHIFLDDGGIPGALDLWFMH